MMGQVKDCEVYSAEAVGWMLRDDDITGWMKWGVGQDMVHGH
jgi:hypothetical protein